MCCIVFSSVQWHVILPKIQQTNAEAVGSPDYAAAKIVLKKASYPTSEQDHRRYQFSISGDLDFGGGFLPANSGKKNNVKTALRRKIFYFRFTFDKQTSFGTMLEMCKEVLTKVSFDRLLFRKELQKAIRWMKGEDLLKLKQWCMDQFGTTYRDIILSSFRPVM